MDTFNSDVLDRLAVGVDLANAFADGLLPAAARTRPTWVFDSHRYRAPTRSSDWDDLAGLAPTIDSTLRRVVAGDHEAVVSRLNQSLAEQQVTPFVERSGERWVLHHHARTASFAAGWAAGIDAALAVGYSTGDVHRVGSCDAPGCRRFFLDRGRNRQRQFCSLRCQNRAKSATYRVRRDVGPGATVRAAGA